MRQNSTDLRFLVCGAAPFEDRCDVSTQVTVSKRRVQITQ
jgi:hypothetical protein